MEVLALIAIQEQSEKKKKSFKSFKRRSPQKGREKVIPRENKPRSVSSEGGDQCGTGKPDPIDAHDGERHGGREGKRLTRGWKERGRDQRGPVEGASL